MEYSHVVGQRRIDLVADPRVVAFRAEEEPTARLRKRLREHAERATTLGIGGLTLLHVEEPDRREVVRDVVSRHRTAREHRQVFRMGGHHLIAGPDVLVRFQPGARRSQILERLRLSTRDRHDAVHVVEHEEGRPFEFAEELRAHADVAWAEPHFTSVHYRPHLSAPKSDAAARRKPKREKGYELRLTKTWDAWATGTGTPEIKIAVVDEGIQATHPSLEPVVAGSYDAVRDRSGQAPRAWDYHGTACAGLAAAAPGSGPVRGFGGGCGLLCVRMGYTTHRDTPELVTRSLWMARGLIWAWKNGASVLSCSWSAGEHSNAVVQAIDDARTKGRKGKGCVVVFSAGNEGDVVDFPASLPGVVTVAASNQFDEPKTGTSRDGERFWASNFGPEVDLAAPAIGIVTLDNRGAGGEAGGDFIDDFNGTSSATPMVAGIAGLVLSANPALTESDVGDILRQSADKVPDPSDYDGARNDRMGHGRLNAVEALKLASG